MNIYSKLCKARDNIIFETDFSRGEKMKMLTQLMGLAFNNRNSHDKLPKVFQIHNINIMEEYVISEVFEKSFKIKVKSVKIIERNFIKGSTFEVEIY